jgi:predicted RNase H-like nuclease (RuvC/YqgF family)
MSNICKDIPNKIDNTIGALNARLKRLEDRVGRLEGGNREKKSDNDDLSKLVRRIEVLEKENKEQQEKLDNIDKAFGVLRILFGAIVRIIGLFA